MVCYLWAPDLSPDDIADLLAAIFPDAEITREPADLPTCCSMLIVFLEDRVILYARAC